MSATGSASDHEHLRPEPPTTYYGDLIRTPGYGDAPDRCRDLKPVGFCDHGHAVLGRSSCGTRRCPDHWRDWIEEATINVVARLAAYREAVDGAEARCHHIAASPPQDRRYSVERFWETRSEAYDALEAAGVAGGAAIPHAYRTNERADALFETAVQQGEVDEGTGRWRFLRDATDGWEDLTRYIEPSPHYHGLATGEDIDGEAVPDGWVVTRIRTVDRFHAYDSESYRDMASVVYYVLTHAAVQQGRQAVTYFGDVHPAAFDPEEELTAARWDRIQAEAEAAVRNRPGEEPATASGAGTCEVRECPREGCDAGVHDLAYIDQFMRDDEWVEAVRRSSGGWKRWLRLRGLRAFVNGETDRPPPAARSSSERFREWLEDRGRALTPGPRSVGLDAFGGGTPWMT